MLWTFLAGVNWLAVVVAAVASMVVGFLWYSPFLFGKRWMELSGVTPELEAEAKKGRGRRYILAFIGALITAAALAVLVVRLDLNSFESAVKISVLVWLGFVATTGATAYIFAVRPRPWSLFWLNTLHELISLFVAAVILALWR